MVCPIDGDVPLVLLCAMATGAPIKIRSTIEMLVVFTLLLLFHKFLPPQLTAPVDSDAPRRNNPAHDSAFPAALHVGRQKNFQAVDSWGRPALCRLRREYPARIRAGKARIPCPLASASTVGHVPASCANARFPAQDRRGAGSRA